jgi:HYR domain/Domain of unknown function DUF11/CARDB/Secretion system C-terminal sorting domain
MTSFKPSFSVALWLPLSPASLRDFALLNILMFFSVFVHGQSSQQATLVKDIQVGVGNSNPNNFTTVGNTVYFTTIETTVTQLWKSDGTTTGTVKIGPILGNPQGYNGKLYYTKKYNLYPDTDKAVLWSYDGSTLTIVDTIATSYGLISNTFLSVIGSNLSVQVNFYPDYSPSQNTNLRFLTKGVKGDFKNGGATNSKDGGCEIRISDNHYIADTLAFYDYSSFTCGNPFVSALYSVKKGQLWSAQRFPIGKLIKSLGLINARLLFIAPENNTSNAAYGNPIYNLYNIGVDGDNILIKANVSAAESIGAVQSFNGKIYYRDGSNIVWETDGTAAGTIALTDGTTPTLPLSMGDPFVIGDGLYFFDATTTDYRVWKIGTSGNIRKVLTVPNLNDKTFRLKVFNNELYHFSTANTSTTDKQISLFKIDVVNGTRLNVGVFYGLDYENTASFVGTEYKNSNNYAATTTKLYGSANNASTAANPTGQELYQLPLDASCTNDNVAPYFGSCPANSVKIITTDRDTSWYGSLTAFDNCSAPNITQNITGYLTLNVYPTLTQVITARDSTARFEYTATDAKGNIGKCIFTVKVVKPCVPTAAVFNSACPKDTVISTFDACTRVSWQVPTATDNCGVAANVYQSQGLPSGSCFAVGVNRIVYKKQYGLDSCTFKITVNQVVNPCATDTIAPVFQNCPANINVTTAGTNAIVTWAPLTATDNCSGAAINLGNYSSGFAFPLGVSNVVFAATDAKGNKGYCNFNVTVSPQNVTKDICISPTANIVGKTSSITITGIKTSSAIIQIFNNAWSSVYNQQVSADSVTISNLVSGSYNVKVTVLETGGRWPAVCEVVVNNVNVSTGTNPCDVDIIPPVFSNCPTNITLSSSTSTAVATWTAPTAADNCSTPLVLSSHNSGFAFPVGTSTVTYTATDAKGNKSTCSFNVTVNLLNAAKPDLVVEDILRDFFASQMYSAGTIAVRIKNIGIGSSRGSFDVKLYISEDSLFSLNDSLFATGVNDIAGIDFLQNQSQIVTLNMNGFAPRAIVGKPYWFIARVDTKNAIDEFNENNNVSSKAIISVIHNNLNPTFQVSKTAGFITPLALNNTVNYGDTINFFHFHNAYSGTPTNEFPKVNYRLYFSTDTAYSNNDYLIETGLTPIGTDRPSSNYGYFLSNFVTNALGTYPTGSYYMVVQYDYNDSFGESNERDNHAYVLINWVNNGSNLCINDAIPPVLSNCPTNISLTTTASTATANWTTPTATDNCSTPSVSSTYNSGFAFPIGVTPVTYSATDAKGNTAKCSFNVTVTQQSSGSDICTNPMANVVGGAGSITVTGITTSSAAIQVFTSTWNSIYNQQVTGTSATIPNLAVGKYIVKVTVLGTGGKWPAVCNVQVENVSVTSGTNPCATDVTPPTFANCPTNINLTTTGTTAIATWTDPTATDNCGTPSVLSNYNSGFAFPLGTTAVTYTATDAKGNKATCSFNVVVAQSIGCRQRDSLILVDIYNNMGGVNWFASWDRTKPIDTWYGVILNANGCVVDLGIWNAIGNLVPSIGKLSELEALRFNGNGTVTGTLPSELGNLKKLKVLEANSNKLTGSIPPSFGNLTNMEDFRLYGNQLTGSIPVELGNLKKVKTFLLYLNQLSGEIPSSLGGLDSVKAFFISSNKLTGKIPNSLGNLKSVEALDLGSNLFIDTLPKIIASLPKLALLRLQNNLLSGCIPSEYKTLCGKDVDLSNNPNLLGGGNWAAFCSSNTGICPTITNDLELTMSSNPSVFKKWTTINTTVSIKNIGNQAFTNIEVNVPAPKGTSAGGTGLPSVGTWQPYCSGGVLCYKWTIPSLAANATATLTIPLFVLNVDTAIVASAKLLTSTPVDNNATNNTASVTIAPAPTQQIAALSVRKPTQYIPVIIQKISPNPTDGDVYIDVESLDERDMRFEFFNAQGQNVYNEMQHLKKGSNQLYFNITDKESGLYFVKPETSGGRNVPVKFVKL